MGSSQPAFPNGPGVSGCADSYYPRWSCRAFVPKASGSMSARPVWPRLLFKPAMWGTLLPFTVFVCVCVVVEPVFLQLEDWSEFKFHGTWKRTLPTLQSRVEVRQTRPGRFPVLGLLGVNTLLWHFVSHCVPLLQCRVALSLRWHFFLFLVKQGRWT